MDHKRMMAMDYAKKKSMDHKAHGGMAHWSSCPTCMNEGGEVDSHEEMLADMGDSRRKMEQEEKPRKKPLRGIHEAATSSRPGYSEAGNAPKSWHAKSEHKRVLGELQSMKHQDRTNLAEGGEVESMEDPLEDALGGELLQAFESKSKKDILEAIRAAVLMCKE